MNMERIEFDPDELDVAMQWHGGQDSMLYAIASTGSLSRGTSCPRTDCDACGGFKHHCEECHGRGQPMTDAQWLAYLAGKLESEAEECAGEARKQARSVKRSDTSEERREMRLHAALLDSIAMKCREAVAKLNGGAS